MISFLYAILVFLVLRFSVTLFNFLSNPKLGLSLRHYTDLISICIDAKDFTGENPLDDLITQDYQQIEILVKLTGDPMLDYHWNTAYGHHRSVHLLGPGVDSRKEASGNYLLFLKPSVVLKNGSLQSMMHRMKTFRLTLLSVIPAQVSTGFPDIFFQPLYNFVLLGLVPLRLIRLSGSPMFSAGSSECMLFDKKVYLKEHWLDGLFPADIGGIEMIKLVKEHRLKTETLLGGRLVKSYAHGSAEVIFKRTGNRVYGLLGNNIFALLCYLVLVVAGPVAMFFSLNLNLLILPAGLIFLSRIMQSFLSGQSPVKNLILHPLQMLVLGVSLIFTAAGRFIRSQQK